MVIKTIVKSEVLVKTEQLPKASPGYINLQRSNREAWIKYAKLNNFITDKSFVYSYFLNMSSWIGVQKSESTLDKSIKEVLNSPMGTELLKKFFETPEGKKIIQNEILDLYKDSKDETNKFEDYETPFICDMSRKEDDEVAEIEIKEFINTLKNKGVQEFNLLDVSLKTNFPFEQINRILDKLKKESD